MREELNNTKALLYEDIEFLNQNRERLDYYVIWVTERNITIRKKEVKKIRILDKFLLIKKLRSKILMVRAINILRDKPLHSFIIRENKKEIRRNKKLLSKYYRTLPLLRKIEIQIEILNFQEKVKQAEYILGI